MTKLTLSSRTECHDGVKITRIVIEKRISEKVIFWSFRHHFDVVVSLCSFWVMKKMFYSKIL